MCWFVLRRRGAAAGPAGPVCACASPCPPPRPCSGGTHAAAQRQRAGELRVAVVPAKGGKRCVGRGGEGRRERLAEGDRERGRVCVVEEGVFVFRVWKRTAVSEGARARVALTAHATRRRSCGRGGAPPATQQGGRFSSSWAGRHEPGEPETGGEEEDRQCQHNTCVCEREKIGQYKTGVDGQKLDQNK